jgi:acyl carrier protein
LLGRRGVSYFFGASPDGTGVEIEEQEMTAITVETSERIKEIVTEILEIEDDDVTETSLFADDHGADSLRAIEILAALEKEFNVVIDQAELSRMVNLQGVHEVVAEALPV